MRVKTLLELLSRADPNALVILSKDSEGNNHSPIESIEDDRFYHAKNTWSGDVFQKNMGTDSVVKTDPCVVLIPIN